MKKWILAGLVLILGLSLFSADVSAQGITDRGKMWMVAWAFQDSTAFDTLFIMLCEDGVTPDKDTETFATLDPIPTGNGYQSTGGIGANEGYLIPGTDFNTITEDDGYAYIRFRDIVWTAAGGPIPASGDGARWAVLTDNNTTIDSREVLAWFDLTSERSVTVGNTLTLQDLEIRLVAP